MNLRCVPALFFIVFACLGIGAQNFSREGSDKALRNLPDEKKVDFINKNFYALYSADFENARELAKWAAEKAHEKNWPIEEAYAQLNWGVITYLSGEYENVLPKYFKAIEIFEAVDSKEGIAKVNNEMTVFYRKQSDDINAEKCMNTAEKLAREVNNQEILGTALSNKGLMLLRKGNYKEAKPYYEEVFEIRKKAKDSVGLGYVYLDLAEIALHQNNIALSISYIDKSTEIRELINDVQGQAVNYVTKGETYFNTKDYKNSIKWLQKGLDQALLIRYDELVRFTYDFLAQAYVASGDYTKAYGLQHKAHAYKDSLFNLQKTKVIEELQTHYETEKKDQRITFLDQENELKTATIQRNYFLIVSLVVAMALVIIIFYFRKYRDTIRQKAVMQEQKIRLREAQINAVIESQEKERKRFATDLHDGMGQVIAALQLNIQALKSNTSNYEKRDTLFNSAEQLLSDAHTEIRNIAFNLMPPVLVKEGLVAAIQELVRKINTSGKLKASITVFDGDKRFSEVVETSLYRIIQELLSNIIKHAHANEINISFTGFESECILTVEDDGEGYDLSKFQNNDGNGWRNIYSRANMIKAKVEFDTLPGRKNNNVTIMLPITEFTFGYTDVSVLQNTEN